MRDTSVPVGAQCGAAAAQEILDANVAPQTSAKSDGPTAFTDTPPTPHPRHGRVNVTSNIPLDSFGDNVPPPG